MSLDLSPRRVVKVDPQEFRPDVHACFAKYRPLTGLIDTGGGMLLVIRHADVERLMADPGTRQIEADLVEMRGIASGALHRFFSNSMLTSNPPAHANRRGPTARAFAFKLIQEWRPRIRQVVLDLIERNAGKGTMEFVQDIASSLPARIIAEILGIPEEDAPQFAALVYGMSKGLSNFRAEELESIEAHAIDLMAYVEKLLNSRRHRPRDDFLTDYLKSVAEADLLSETETLIQIVTLIIGGSDTTRFGLTAMISLLLQHRHQWERVCADPGLAPAAVREAVRFEPAIGAVGRVVVEPLTVDGVRLDPGTLLSLSLCSAQRDETVYSAPQSFDITRQDHPRWSVSFGGGAHRCMGEALARAEMEEALIALSQRLPGLELADGPAWVKGSSGLRSIGPLPLRWPGG